MTRFLIRDAEAADAPALQDVFRRSSLSNPGDRANLLANPDALEFSLPAVKEGCTRAAVADVGIVGFATSITAGLVTEIEDLFVDPDWLRQGAGRALVSDLMESARGRGARRVEVTANTEALPFYQKIGFVFDRAVETRFGPALRLYRELTP